MLCPFINDSCVKDECAMWSEDQCAIAAGAKYIYSNQLGHPEKPMAILEACAKHYNYSEIGTLTRREIDDFLALSHLALNAMERRKLSKAMRALHKKNKANESDDPTEWRRRESNRNHTWSSDEDEDVRNSYTNGMSLKDIAKAHKRSELSVQFCLQRLGLPITDPIPTRLA